MAKKSKPLDFDGALTLARGLPGVEEGTSYGTRALKVRKKLIARLREDGDSLVVKIEIDARDGLIEQAPGTFYITDHYRDHPWILVRLSKVEEGQLWALLEQAWTMTAPSRLVAERRRDRACPAVSTSAPEDRRAARILTPDDWLVWRALRLAALATDPRSFGSRLADWQGDGDREDRWRRRLGVDGSRNFVVDLDGRPSGIASGFPGSAVDVRELISMWVAPWARGRGVGDALIRAVLAWAEADGASAVELKVVVGNAPATGLYRRHGFAETGEVDEPAEDGRREARMVRPL